MFNEINTLKPFFEEPSREFNVREVARKLNISPANASKRLENLVKNRILKKRKYKIFLFYRADLDSDAYRDMKIYYNIRKIRNSGLLDVLNDFYLKPPVIMFGSAATGMDNEDSDFDILVISEKKTEFENRKKFEKKLNRKLQLFVVGSVKELKNEHLINNVLNGITLQGKVKWI